MNRAPFASEEHLWSCKNEGKRSVCWVGGEMVDGGQDMVAGSKTAEKLSPITQT